MASWGVDEARARLSNVLDTAEAAGPQLMRRMKRKYVVTTEEEMEKRFKDGKERKGADFVSLADALEPPFSERYDVEMRTDENGIRWMDFGESS